MERKTGIIKIMGCLSSALLVFLFIGYLMAPHNMNTTVNYCFSDQSELEGFELELEEENISFSQISDTTVNISKNNEEQADTIFYQITNNAIDDNWCIEHWNEDNGYDVATITLYDGSYIENSLLKKYDTFIKYSIIAGNEITAFHPGILPVKKFLKKVNRI